MAAEYNTAHGKSINGAAGFTSSAQRGGSTLQKDSRHAFSVTAKKYLYLKSLKGVK
ncbi:hypothetical protein [Siccibacter turicensis]